MDTPRERLRFLLETVALEAQYLQDTDGRLFVQPFTAERAAGLRADPLLAERLDAFGARFARLQDTAGDKLLPALLVCVGEPVGSVIDNLDRAAPVQPHGARIHPQPRSLGRSRHHCASSCAHVGGLRAGL